jgi:hypothetical protein
MHQRLRSWSAAVFPLAGVAIIACSDGTLAPTPARNTPTNRVAADAAGSPAAEVILLHGSRGRAYRYVLRGNTLLSEGGGEITLTETAAANLRRMARVDAQVERLAAAARPYWAKRGLPDLDNPGPAPTASVAKLPEPRSPSTLPSPFQTAPSQPANVERASSSLYWGDCNDLFIQLYNTTQLWRLAVDAATQAAIGAFDACTNGYLGLPECMIMLDLFGWRIAVVEFWEANLNAIAWAIGLFGCM